MDKGGNDRILLAHGGGGQLTAGLLGEVIIKRLANDTLSRLDDSAVLELDSSSVCFTTDSYVVKPLFFKGGDIGKLSVCGTLNDLAVQGARPRALSLGLIIETGFEIKKLERIIDSIAAEAEKNNVEVVTGDTKTVEPGKAEGIFINTAGIGTKIPGVELGFEKIQAGDKIIINGTIGDHGMTIMAMRKEIDFQTDLKSDCACLSGLISEILAEPEGIRFFRDPTRGGLATALNDISARTGLSIEISEQDIPIDKSVQAAADILGFDVLNIANEGKFIAVVSDKAKDRVLDICRSHQLGKEAAVIGEVVAGKDVAIVEMKTKIGGRRIIQTPYGRQLPRIC